MDFLGNRTSFQPEDICAQGWIRCHQHKMVGIFYAVTGRRIQVAGLGRSSNEQETFRVGTGCLVPYQGLSFHAASEGAVGDKF
jgi:hypothetical protein